MTAPPKLVVEARKKLATRAAVKVLVVEGKDDLAIYARWLDQLAASHLVKSTLELIAANGKLAVLACLRWFADNGGEPRVFGLVDRDDWDAATVADWRATLPQLRLNDDRHAIESYFCDPDEVGPALSAIDAAWSAQLSAFRAAVAAALTDYVAHWALLTTTERLKTRMFEQGYPGHFSTTVPVPPDADVQARFSQWATTIDASAAFAEFDALRAAAFAATATMRYRSHLWAKLFFERVIHPQLTGPPTTNQKSTHDWMIDLAANSPVPADVAAILGPLL